VDFSDCPLAWDSVTNFQSQVYRAALEVKSGLTATYGDLARAIGQPPGASRAVGTALGQNPWPLIVPCHRFVGANGKMTGFSGNGGIATKLKLLAIEGSELFGE
jgi:methylated-DNA-[protein]-cysteine S-methyltransferase